MYHYSYVFPRQVETKISYYKAKISRDNCIDNYYNEVYLPWVTGDEDVKRQIENKYMGVHEFKPNIRGGCYTAKFKLNHPESIENDLKNLKEKFNNQLSESLVKNNNFK
jgi:hypothetical protein